MDISNIGVKWELFQPSEKRLIEDCLRAGKWQSVGAALLPMYLTLEKEKEVQKIINVFAPKTIGFESKVRQEMLEEESKSPKLFIRSPEEERIWQEKLDKEMEEWNTQQEINKQNEDAIKEKTILNQEIPEKKHKGNHKIS